MTKLIINSWELVIEFVKYKRHNIIKSLGLEVMVRNVKKIKWNELKKMVRIMEHLRDF